MLGWLLPLFFFAALMGSPVVGFVVFMLLGVVALWPGRRTNHSPGWAWTAADGWLALSFMSIPLFKALSALWSDAPYLALGNAGWHMYFMFWPLVLLGLHTCKTTQQRIDQAIALGLITTATWRLAFQLTQWPWLNPGAANLGILAQLTMTVGLWNVLALTRQHPVISKGWRGVHGLALLGTLVILVLSTRRLELLCFGLLTAVVIAYRLRHWLTVRRTLLGSILVIGFMAILVYLRWEKFVLGFEQIAQYREHGANTPDFTVNSWGIRLELWRVGLAAFLDHPWLGISASARPFNMQAWGAPAAELFMHRHFHSHLVQTLVEGGLLGLLVLCATVGYGIHKLMVQTWRPHNETALLSAALLGAYVAEGTASAALHYDKANALLVVMSAWLWLQARGTSGQTRG